MVDYILELILTSIKNRALIQQMVQWIMALKTQRKFYRANIRKPV